MYKPQMKGKLTTQNEKSLRLSYSLVMSFLFLLEAVKLIFNFNPRASASGLYLKLTIKGEWRNLLIPVSIGEKSVSPLKSVKKNCS